MTMVCRWPTSAWPSTLASYQAGRGELAAVLAARSSLLELRLRALALDAERSDLQVRLNTLIAEQTP